MSLFGSKTKVKDIRTKEKKSAQQWLEETLRSPTPTIPTQGVAGMSEAEQMAQSLLGQYAGSTPEGMDVLRGFTTAQGGGGITPEIQALLDEVLQTGQQETARVGRKVQLAGAGRSSTGTDALGRSVENTQRNMMNVALPYIMQAKEQAENRKLTAAQALATLGESSMLNRLNALSTTGSLPRMLEQLQKDAEYAAAMQQINFPYQQQASLAAILSGSQGDYSITQEQSLFSQMSPLITAGLGLF